MEHKIKVGGVSFVVDDPRGKLTRTAETDLRVEHEEAEVLEASVRTVQSRPSAPTIHSVDPMGSMYARAHLFDKVVNGKHSLASIALAWMLFGVPMSVVALGIGYRLYDDWHHMPSEKLWLLTVMGLVPEVSIVICVGLLVRRTARVMRERKRVQATAAS
jgi:hypothetical protein